MDIRSKFCVGQVVRIKAKKDLSLYAVILDVATVELQRRFKVIYPSENAAGFIHLYTFWVKEDDLLAAKEADCHKIVVIGFDQLGQFTVEATSFFTNYFPSSKLKVVDGVIVFEAVYDTRNPEDAPDGIPF